MPSGSDLDIGRLEIAVDDALLVRRFERFGDLLRGGQRLVNRHRALCDAIRQCRPLDQLHHERDGVTGLLQPMDLGDVGMVERGEDFGLALEARQPLGIARHRLRQYLDCDRALQIGVRRPIHLSHPALADLGGDFIRAEAGAGREGHDRAVVRIIEENRRASWSPAIS